MNKFTVHTEPLSHPSAHDIPLIRRYINVIKTSNKSLDVDEAISKLSSISFDPRSRATIIQEGGIKAIIDLLLSSTENNARYNGCGALGNLAQHSEEAKERIAQEGEIKALVKLPTKKISMNVTVTLMVLAFHNDRALMMGLEGAVKPLIQLLTSSKTTSMAKNYSFFILVQVLRGPFFHFIL